MINRWEKFNESNSSEKFKSEVQKIRSYFIEFEDDNIISYNMRVHFDDKDENDMCWSINPNTADFDRWLDSLTEVANRYFSSFSSKSKYGRSMKYFCLCANIKIKSDSNSCISGDSIYKLEDVLVAFKRLNDEYDKVLLDMNSNHHLYKPVTLKVYFNPTVD
jgi:hypothetical protein